MAQGRPDIPTTLKRAVLVESGHRCAIPTCRQTPVELAHITPWVKVQEHTFENLIALCPTCHTRYDRGEIDRKAMLQYKVNLEIVNQRYTDTERQLLRVLLRQLEMKETFRKSIPAGTVLAVHNPKNDAQRRLLEVLHIHRPMWWLIANLLDDELVRLGEPWPMVDHSLKPIMLTEKGNDFIRRWASAQPL
ncbi:HNH endonuclease [Streptomyces melanosporofaciens]|uniref:HNH endonuclease n=1 Tax=Streptomyces sp. CY1 TaxID=3388313 RepID=UPI0039A01DD9